VVVAKGSKARSESTLRGAELAGVGELGMLKGKEIGGGGGGGAEEAVVILLCGVAAQRVVPLMSGRGEGASRGLVIALAI
jgi:hypothetical protein